MPNAGFFLGGMAEGMDVANRDMRANEALGLERQQLGLRERALAQEGGIADRRIGLEGRSLDIKEQAIKREERNRLTAETDAAIGNTMQVISETISAGLAAGRDPAQLQKAVAPLLADVSSLARRAGRDPMRYQNMVSAMLTNPNIVESHRAQGAAAAAKTSATLGNEGAPAGSVLPGMPTDTEKNELAKATVAYRVLDQELKDFGSLIQQNGVSFFPGTAERTAYDTSRRNIQLQMKELYNLGVLNGPDLMLLDQMLVDPTTRGSANGEKSSVKQDVLDAASAPLRGIYKSFTLQKNAETNIGMLREQIKRMYETKRDVTMRVAPKAETSNGGVSGTVDWRTYFGAKQ